MKIVGVSGTIVGSKTAVLVKKVLEAMSHAQPGIAMELLDLKQYDVQFCDGRDPASYTDDTKKVIDTICSADLLIFGTPVFQGSITGVTKNVFDLLPADSLRHKVVGLVATGGTYQHYLVIENQLRPILAYFRAFVAPGYVYAHMDHFDENNDIADVEVLLRIQNLAAEMTLLSGLWEAKAARLGG
ncbi:NADPH-dependent FMN reductase [Paenibacillus xerothermodurans]|uniref:NADPH-dependent oxidoreductase n=1 Tax=Paenibacillus xerothermodurans TaxID=1977292 RepID=A0A2W1NE39_PAEXE|nr:NAD(P)H-dependent oxidoreductase [Paenibacillus xerothermodurans]PZE21391.1 NADPH-dependent oxidoreductase [Paenibacillus xerothermodurans]